MTGLDCYFDQFHQNCSGDVDSQSTAHAYRQLALNSECWKYETIEDVVNAKINYGCFGWKILIRRQSACRFNHEDLADAYPRLTDRTVTASFAKCFEYWVVNERNGRDTSHLGNARAFTYTNDSFTGNVSIPIQKVGWEGSKYVYRFVGQFANAGC